MECGTIVTTLRDIVAGCPCMHFTNLCSATANGSLSLEYKNILIMNASMHWSATRSLLGQRPINDRYMYPV
eukprot:m.1194189 g.1194189  ORF g.1194189 m.1194189 type:complete len:71 (-) comp24561_c0_seq2:1826-2038(-)